MVPVERTTEEAANTKESKTVRERHREEEGESIYLDDGSYKKKKPETVKPQRKLTRVCLYESVITVSLSFFSYTSYQAQLAAMEALASFGGSDLGSVNVKRRDLREELKRETEVLKSQEAVPEDSTKRPCTRWAGFIATGFSQEGIYPYLAHKLKHTYFGRSGD